MRRLFVALMLSLALIALAPAPAFARTHVFVGLNCCGYGYGPSPYWGYPAYPAYYYAPPPVVYAPPPVVYAPQPQVVYVEPQQAYAAPNEPPPLSAVPSGPEFSNDNGQTCREFQSSAMIDGRAQRTYGTACQQPDGTWRVTP